MSLKPPAAMAQRTLSFFAIPFIVAIGFLVYANSFSAEFHFDDNAAIIENFAIRDVRNIPEIWQSFNTRFLTMLSFALNYSVGKLNVGGYHLVNTSLHIFCGLCVFWFVSLIFKTPALRKSFLFPRSFYIAVFSAIIFMVHPVQTQAVVYIAQRAALLASLFYLLTLNLYLKWRLTNRLLFYRLALATAILGMFSKEMTFTLPLALFLCDFFFFELSKEGLKKQLRLLTPFFLTLLIIPLTLASDTSPHSLFNLGHEVSLMQFNALYVLTEMNVLCTYLRLLFLPINQNLDYDYPLSPGFFSLGTFPCFLILAGIVIWAARIFRRQRIFSFCIAWFFLAVSVEAVVCALVSRDMLYEHYLYLPMVGFSIFISTLVLGYLKDKRVVLSVAVMCVVTLSYLTYQRTKIWRDPITLWKDTLCKSPYKPRCYINLGVAYNRNGEPERAIHCYYKAIEVYLMQAGTLPRSGSSAFARKDLTEEPLLLDPDLIDGYCRWHLMNSAVKNNRRIKKEYQHFFSRRNLTLWYTNLAAAYGNKKDYAQEIKYSQKALELDSHNALAMSNLGLAYAHQGDYAKAFEELTRALALNPHLSQTYNNFGFLHTQQKDYQKARAYFEKAIELNPRNQQAHDNLIFIDNILKSL